MLTAKHAKFLFNLISFSLPPTLIAQPSPARSNVVPESLKCNRQSDPIGIDNRTPSFSWLLRAQDPNARNLVQTAYQIVVASSLTALKGDEADLWDSGQVSSDRFYDIEYHGKDLHSHATYFWKVRVWDGNGNSSGWSRPGSFTTALLAPEDWKAHWIAAEPDGPPSVQARENVGTTGTAGKPMPVFRHDFQIDKQVQVALLFISGLGHYEAHINGKNITDSVLTPGWTDYRKRVLYNTYRVTSLLHTGQNAIGILLGNGMYNVEGTKGRYTKFTGSFGQLKLIAQLYLRFTDGSEAEITSGKGWKTISGPIAFSSIFGGEDYDARRESAGWDLPGFVATGWAPALEVQGPGGTLFAEHIEPMRCVEHLKPVKVTEPQTGIFVYDFGKNFAGWPEVTVKGAAGSFVKLVGGELLESHGLVTQASAHAFPDSQNSFTYILNGHGEERWHPRFSYYGFRYLQVETTPAKLGPQVLAVESNVVHDDVPLVGDFSSSQPLFSQIHQLIDAAILSNMASVLTDCPHREKLGWLEQTYLAGTSILFNFDASGLYRKMADDIADEQQPNGMVPSIAPEFVAFVDKAGKNTPFRDSPEWGSAVVLSAWTAYQMSGDLTILKEHYASMLAYVEYLASRARDGMLSYGLGDWYDIGPGEPGPSKLTSKGLSATATYFADLTVLSRIAEILGKADQADMLKAKARAVRDSFNQHLFHPDTNQYDQGSQTANAMPLALKMVPEGHCSAVLANLVTDIRNHGNHVTAGDVGFHYVVRALTDGGESAVLYDMLSRRDRPSYGDQLAHGATTLTEAWDANPNSSQNHFMLGHAEEWFYRGLAGIRIDMSASADRRIEIAPSPVGDVREASASYNSVLGTVRSRWSRDGERFILDVVIPAGASATILLPKAYQNDLQQDGRLLRLGEHVVGSGSYQFTGRLSPRTSRN